MSKSSDGLGFVGFLLLLFITLKLCGVIGWSWWWVLAPAWICAGLVAILFTVTLIAIIKLRIK